MGDRARDAAIRALARQARGYPDMLPDALDRALDPEATEGAAEMSPLDRAFAYALYEAAVRRWLGLAYLLNGEIRQGFDALEPRIKGVLLAGAAQLLLLDRVPAHAAINHAVEWAKSVVRPGAGGLVNAVLRKIAALRAGAEVEAVPWDQRREAWPLADGRSLRFAESVLPEEAIDRLAIATSHPRVLLERWAARFGMERTVELALHSVVEAPLVVNIEHADANALAAVEGFGVHEHPLHRVYEGTPGSLGPALRELPGAWVQDAASAHAVRSIAGEVKPSLIVDLCAGNGTKTRQLAATFPSAAVVATDIDRGRFATLEGAFKGSERVRVLPYERAKDETLGKADLILLDVPCSNTGVLPRRPEARYRFGPESLESLAGVQRQIVADAIPLMNADPGSHPAILYSTCSLEEEENQGMAAWAVKWHGFRRGFESAALPVGQPGEAAAKYRDGAYSVLLVRGSM